MSVRPRRCVTIAPWLIVGRFNAVDCAPLLNCAWQTIAEKRMLAAIAASAEFLRLILPPREVAKRLCSRGPQQAPLLRLLRWFNRRLSWQLTSKIAVVAALYPSTPATHPRKLISSVAVSSVAPSSVAPSSVAPHPEPSSPLVRH